MELQRLLEEEQKAVVQCRDTVAQWEKFRDDYQALQQRLTTLPDRLKHDVMVPIGKHAFMPGHLYHTNEITVLLGDNWFAQVTAKQAQSIVSRRQKVVEEKLSDAKRQLKDIEAKLAFTTAFQQQESVEIKEKLSDDHPVSKKRIAHTRKSPSVAMAPEKKGQDGDAELWKRLDELEHEEEDIKQVSVNQQEQLEEEMTKITTEIHEQAATNVINISHTALSVTSTTSATTYMPSSIINSPADICVKKSSVDSAEHAEEPAVKSKSVHWSSDITPTIPESHTDALAPHVPKPFTGSVVEKSSSTAIPTDTGRKVSRFKASRQT